MLQVHHKKRRINLEKKCRRSQQEKNVLKCEHQNRRTFIYRLYNTNNNKNVTNDNSEGGGKIGTSSQSKVTHIFN